MKKILNFVLCGLIFCVTVFSLTGCGSTNPSKLIFRNSPYVENNSLSSSDWYSFNFEIKKNGNYSFEFSQHKYRNKSFTEINFDKVEGSWEYIGTFTQDYKVYQTQAKLVSDTKHQSLAIYKLNGLVGGFYGKVDDDGNIITKEVGSYQGYCVYRYGDKSSSWTLGKYECICIFFTNETVNEALLDSTIDDNSLNIGWRYDNIGKVNYCHTVRV